MRGADGSGGPPPPPPHGRDKAAWRAWARQARGGWAAGGGRAEAEHAMAAHLRSWPPWRRATWALVYLPFADEPDPLGPLAASGALEGGPRLATTRTPPGRGPLSLHELDARALEQHDFGFRQPRAAAPTVPAARLDVALVPGLCFDRRGTRLGYGRGLYDRLLARLPARCRLVGVTPEALVVDELPREGHDVAVAWLLSEAGLRRVEARDAAA